MAFTYFQYGSYPHPQGEVNLLRYDVQNRLSPRGFRLSAIHTMHIGGELLGDDQAAVLVRAAEIIDAYAIDDVDATLFDNAGNASRYRMQTNAGNNLTGVRVIQKSWPKGDYEELASQRTFAVTLQCEIDEVYDQLISFRERLRFIGTGGPRIADFEYATATPTQQIINTFTMQRIIQSGSAVGWGGYPIYPGPIFGGAVLEHQDQREIDLGGPQMMGKLYRGYEVEWRYAFSAVSAQVAVPNFS